MQLIKHVLYTSMIRIIGTVENTEVVQNMLEVHMAAFH